MSVKGEKYIGADGQTYHLWRASEGDNSPQHKTYPSGYSAKCSHCYFGQAHSVQAHQAELSE